MEWYCKRTPIYGLIEVAEIPKMERIVSFKGESRQVSGISVPFDPQPFLEWLVGDQAGGGNSHWLNPEKRRGTPDDEPTWHTDSDPMTRSPNSSCAYLLFGIAYGEPGTLFRNSPVSETWEAEAGKLYLVRGNVSHASPWVDPKAPNRLLLRWRVSHGSAVRYDVL